MNSISAFSYNWIHGKRVYARRSNMAKERWQRAFLKEILDRCFPDADYLATKVNGKYADVNFLLDNDRELGLELKNINHKGKPIGAYFVKQEIISRFTDEHFKGLLLSCRGFTNSALELLKKENVDYAVIPYQVTPTISLKRWIKDKRVAIAFLAKYLKYHDPFRKIKKKVKSASKFISSSISIVFSNKSRARLQVVSWINFLISCRQLKSLSGSRLFLESLCQPVMSMVLQSTATHSFGIRYRL